MNYLTPDLAVKAREQFNLSQAKVALETGISRSYLSQFEGSKRVLEDNQLQTLVDYYKSLGWKPDPAVQSRTVEQHLNSPDHGLAIMDGFVITDEASANYVIEDLIEEYYANSEKIDQSMSKRFKRGLFGGFIEEEALKESMSTLTFMARQDEIVRILHGKTEKWPNPLDGDSSAVKDGTGVQQ